MEAIWGMHHKRLKIDRTVKYLFLSDIFCLSSLVRYDLSPSCNRTRRNTASQYSFELGEMLVKVHLLAYALYRISIAFNQNMYVIDVQVLSMDSTLNSKFKICVGYLYVGALLIL